MCHKNCILVSLLLLPLCSYTINGQCLNGLKATTASTALIFFESLLELKSPTDLIETEASFEAPNNLLVLQFMHQSLDKLINRHIQLGWTNDPDTELWNKLMDYSDPETLVDLLACLDLFATEQHRQCQHLAALSDLFNTYTRTAQGTRLEIFLADVLESTSESCASERVALLPLAIANYKDMDESINSIIEEFYNAPNDVAPIRTDDWQRAELVGQLINELDTMDGLEYERLRRQNVTSRDGSRISLMEFCTIRLQQSEPMRLVDIGHLLEKVEKFRTSLLSNASLDGKSRKWIQLWLLCQKLLH